MIAKSTAIKSRGGKSGGRAVKAVGLTSGGLRCVPDLGLRSSQGDLTATQKSADGIVGGVICRRPERLEVGIRNAHLDGVTRQNTGSVRPAHQD
jgi:RNA-directed DNA polymerase